MNAWVSLDEALEIGSLEAALMDVGRLLQLTPSKHRIAENHYRGLAQHVENSTSPFKDRVPQIYPSGSFAIHAAVRSSIRKDHYDVDAVLELDIPANSDPEWVLDALYGAIKGAPGSRYFGNRIERNSRCITVIYDDGVKVDLMPAVRLPGTHDRVCTLFHHKRETGAKYHKEVNPKGFAEYVNRQVTVSETFTRRFNSRRLLVEGASYGDLMVEAGLANASIAMDERADTAPMPAFLPIDQKSPRIVALQLIKRFRDKRFRKHDDHKGRRKPPSVVMAAQALGAGPVSDSLVQETLTLAHHFQTEIDTCERQGRLIEVFNPAHPGKDRFTDRWPENRADQRLWSSDLRHLAGQLQYLAATHLNPLTISKVFADLFGETVAEKAFEQHYRAKANLITEGRLGTTPSGKVRPVQSAAGRVPAAAAAAPVIAPIRPNTNMGGAIVDADD